MITNTATAGWLARLPKAGRLLTLDQRLGRLLAWLLGAALLLAIAAPLWAILAQAVWTRDGHFAGPAPFLAVLQQPRLLDATLNSLLIAAATTLLVLPAALAYAFALTRSRLPGKPVWRLIALAPLLAPSLLPGISLVYLFGNQGLLKSWLGGGSIYGVGGMVLGEAFFAFPHAVLILATALATADARLYEAAEALGASRVRRFFTLTLPNIRYGLISAGLVVFTLTVTDFGVPKVIGGQTNVLALEVYKQVIGQQNFSQGAVVALLLLLPALLSAGVERWLAGRHAAGLSGRSVAYRPGPNLWRDAALGLACALLAAMLLALLGTAIVASFIKLWPYRLEFTLAHYQFDQMDGGGWPAFTNSLQLAAWTATAGTAFVFLTAYLLEKVPPQPLLGRAIRVLAMLPMAVPGLVLGLGYIFFFNRPDHPLHGLYGSFAILVIATVAHFYTTAHLTLTTALRQLDAEFEAVAATLRRPWWHTCRRVTLPLCLPALFDVARFLWMSAMTTMSCVIFLYTPDTVLAGVAVLNLDDAGETAGAAAMATLIVATALAGTLLLGGLGHVVNRRGQAWRARRA